MTKALYQNSRTPRVSWAVSSDTQKDAFDTYRASFGDLYEVHDVADGGRSGFRSSTTAHLFGPAVLARGRSVAQTLSREAGQVRKSGLDHISLIVNMSETLGDCDGRPVKAEAGSVQFRDLSRPSTTHAASIDVLNVLIPRASVPGWLLARGVHGLVLPGASAGGRLVASHLMKIAEVADDLSDADGVAAIEAAFVIAERFLGNGRSVAPAHTDAIHRTIRERAMTLLDDESGPVRWNGAALARAVGVSRTSLYRAFESTGGVRAYILGRRLSRAYAALRSRRGASPSIEEIGQQHGFADRRAFVQAFRQRFDLSPDDVEPSDARALVDSAEGGLPMDRAMHDVVMDWLRVGEAA